MAGRFNQVDLSQLPAPTIVEQISFEIIFAEMMTDLVERMPTFTALVESDPTFKVLEVAAAREVLLRQMVNEKARGLMLAYATGSDLDQLGANFSVGRLLVTPEDNSVIPPVAAVYESDADFRARITLSLEGYTTAGSEGGYVFHALSASGLVKDVSATSPEPGMVTVYVLSREASGEASVDLLDQVRGALNSDRVRPMTDQVTVMSAAIVEYEITAELTTYPGPDAAVVLAAAQAAVEEYVQAMHRLNNDITLSGIYAALHQPGVQRVELIEPIEDLEIDAGEAGFCTAINVIVSGTTDD